MNTSHWNPDQYLKFEVERTQPAIDLINRIEIIPGTIIDIGCGPGNSTRVLRKRWNDIIIEGLDNSPQMIEKAMRDFPDQKWILDDMSTWKPEKKYDLVFSNAALQWVKNHDSLILKLFDMVKENGALAVQIPANSESYLHKALLKAGDYHKWNNLTGNCKDMLSYLPAETYYTILSAISKKIDMWETIYYHIMNSHEDLIEWYKGTGMKIYLDTLPDEEYKDEFINMILEECRSKYNKQNDGKIIFPFKRLFFIAYRQSNSTQSNA